jgi:membrane protein
MEGIMMKKKVKQEEDVLYTWLKRISFFGPIISLIVVLLLGIIFSNKVFIEFFKILLSLIPLILGFFSFINILSRNGKYLEKGNDEKKEDPDFLRAVVLILERHPKEKSGKVFTSIVGAVAVFVSIYCKYRLYLTYIILTSIMYVIVSIMVDKMYKRDERKIIEYLIIFYCLSANLIGPIALILTLMLNDSSWFYFGLFYLVAIIIYVIIFWIAYNLGPKKNEERREAEEQRKIEEANEKKRKNAENNKKNNKNKKKHRANRTKPKKGK